MRKLIFVLPFVFLSLYLNGQNTIGLPAITNYAKQAYKGGSQNWDIKQDNNGLLYFANNEGLLVFDGNFWKLYPLPNRTIVRSVELRQGRIYVGGQDELGYFEPNRTGTLTYHSLVHLIPASERSFADVWDIKTFDNQLFFRTSTKIFQLSGDKFSITHSKDWRFMESTGTELVAQDYTNGLRRYRGGIWEPVIMKEVYPKGFLVTGLVPFGRDSALLTTFRNGAFILTRGAITPFTSPALNQITGKLIYTAISTGENRFLLGTTLGGCFIIDKSGRLIQEFSQTEGLQNNNILSVFLDRDKNLWVGLDNGIDFIAYDSPIKHIYTSGQNEGSGYAASISNGRLYIGTSNGLYTVTLQPADDLSFVKGGFSPVQDTRGQVWNLSEVNGKLLMGHHEGAFLVQDGRASLLDNGSGFWTFLPYHNVLPSSLMVAGTYNGVKLYDYSSGTFGSARAEARFESARFVAIDDSDGTIWVAHPYKGIFKIKFNERWEAAVKLYTTKDGLLSVNNNYVFKIKNRIITTTENGVYEYNAAKDAFEPSKYFQAFLNKKNIQYLKEDGQGNIWFVHDRKLGVVDLSGGQQQIIYFPELGEKLVNGFEFINPVDHRNILVGGEKGFFHINFEKYKLRKTSPQVLIRMVKAFGKSDSLLFAGHLQMGGAPSLPGSNPEIGSPWNSLHFEFSSTLYGQQDNVEYSYRLRGYGGAWSEWTKRVEKEYTYLPGGSYVFEVKARNNFGNESEVASYTFTILPPWYKGPWAYAAYYCLFFFGIYLLYRWQKAKFALQQKKYEEDQKRLQYMHQLELEKTEKELIKLRNEKLEAEIAHKNTELASTTMHLVQKGEMMTKIKEEMTRIKKNLDQGKTSDDFKKIIKVLNEEDKISEDWEAFAKHFDKVHSDFLTALKAKYPSLTPNELKLSAYLRMNLNTKEVAQLMNISVRGVEVSRYRLRKKLALSTETSLFDFLIRISPAE
ncbi:MAG TPA: two-component regulator propeller domain-containing protein [Flavisolibacter sp.]